MHTLSLFESEPCLTPLTHSNHNKQSSALPAPQINIWRMSQISEFVIRCDGVFQDHDHVYMVQELCSGGDIRAALDVSLHTSTPAQPIQFLLTLSFILTLSPTMHTHSLTHFSTLSPISHPFLLSGRPPL